MGGDAVVRLHLSETATPSELARLAATEDAAKLGRYPDPTYADLIAELATFWQVDRDEIVVGNGSDELLLLSALAYGAGAPGVVTGGTFKGHRYAVEATGQPVIEVPLTASGRIDAIGFAAALDGAGIGFLCTPHNPGGAALEQDELDVIVDAARRTGATLVIDEAYMEYASPGTPSSAVPPSEGIVVLRTFSKAYGLAGLRIGYAIGRASDLAVIVDLQRVIPFRVNRPGAAAAVAALRDQGHLAHTCATNTRRRTWFTSALRARGIEVRPSEANFVAIAVSDPAAVCAHLLDVHGIAVRDASEMGFEGHVRVALGDERALRRIVDVIGEVSGWA